MNELAQAQVAPPAQAPAASQSQGLELAPDQQAQAPALPQPLDAVAAGQQPATILPPVQPNQPPDDVQEFIISNFENLPQLGLEAFEAPDLSTIVFNPQLLDRASIESAVQNGTLEQLLSPPQQGQELAAAAAPAPDAAAAQVAEQHMSQRAATNVEAPKVPASTQNMLAKARVRNMGAGAKPAGLTPNPVGNQLSKRAI